jgi:hypothetical protein
VLISKTERMQILISSPCYFRKLVRTAWSFALEDQYLLILDMVSLYRDAQELSGIEAHVYFTASTYTGDKWTTLKITEGAIVCNIGDQLMRWSDDKLKSTFHRVTCPRPGEYQGDRYSIGFFNQANRNAELQGPGKTYPPIVSECFLTITV